jgi:DNA-binding response OmpR family regulator
MSKILIVDDEDVIRFLISETLGLNSYELFQASDGIEALSVIAEVQPDLLILDAIMPEMPGIEVAKTLSSSKNKPIIIMLTANTDENDRISALHCGVDYFMKKPFSPIELLELVEEILGE